MVHSEDLVQSPNESSGQTSPQLPTKRKKLDDDNLNGSKKARTRVRFVLSSSCRFDLSYYLTFSGPAILVENVTGVSRRCVHDVHPIKSSHRDHLD
jgi:hypothetical protein